MIKKSHELKGLQVRLEKKKAELKLLKEDKEDLDSKYLTCKYDVDTLKKRVDEFSKETKITVSEHALLRYIERVNGVDLNAIREKILTSSLVSSIKAMGNGKHPLDGCRAVVVNNTIVTIE